MHKNIARHVLPIFVGTTIVLAGCERAARGTPPADFAVSSTWLEAALHDLLERPVGVTRLAPPGACPGHFDLRPSQVRALHEARLLLRFDFQAALDAKLVGQNVQVVEIGAPFGMCVPAGYVAACEQIGAALVEAGVLTSDVRTTQCNAVRRRLEQVGERLKRQVTRAGWSGARVITSRHQAEFCRFLGLDVAATLSGADTASFGEIELAIRAGGAARAIIANQPEGRRLADALAQRLSVPVVVFDNFPDDEQHDCRFDRLLETNVARFLAAESR